MIRSAISRSKSDVCVEPNVSSCILCSNLAVLLDVTIFVRKDVTSFDEYVFNLYSANICRDVKVIHNCSTKLICYDIF